MDNSPELVTSHTNSSPDSVNDHEILGDNEPAPHRGIDLARAALAAAREKQAQGQDNQLAGWRAHSTRVRTGLFAARRRGWSGPGSDARDPQLFGQLSSRLILELGWGERLAHAAIFGRWAGLVGTEIAAHAAPVSLREGELTVQATSTAWAMHLRALQQQLLARITAGLGRNIVHRLRVHGPVSPSWRHGPRSVPGLGPRDTYG